jgi:hypothetical protein
MNLIFVAVALVFQSVTLNAEVTTLTKPVWSSCGSSLCYRLTADQAGESLLLPKKLFLSNVNLALFKVGATKPYRLLTSKEALWSEDTNQWVFMDSHYKLDGTTFRLIRE